MRTGTDESGDLGLSVFLAGALHPDHLASSRFREILDALPAAIYTTDSEGNLTYYNPACIELSGRRPTLGSDRWCVTWKLYYPDGTRMPHHECPMAIALKEGRTIRGAEAIAERPDGSRIWFTPYPVPLRDSVGNIVGGINMLVDITESKRREADSRALAALGSEMIVADQPQAIYQKMVEATTVIMHSDFATMQLFHPDRGEAGELELLAQRGFDPEVAKFWQWVSGKSTCVCGLTLRDGARVIIPDAARYPRLDDSQKAAYRTAGILAMQSTPLTSRSGKLLGMISTHWRRPYQPTEGELSNFDILARQAADVIERSQTEDALRESEQQLSAMFAQAGVGVAMLRADDCLILRVNPTFCQIVGYSEEELAGKSCLDLTHPDDLPESRRRLGELLTGSQRTATIEKRYVHKDGRSVWVRVNLAKLADRGEKRSVAMVEDITEQHLAAIGLAEAKEEAEAANIAKDNFLATLSHELRTPLTPVLATLSSWESRQIFPKELADDLEVVRRNVDLEARLIDDLLDLTRIAKGKFVLNMEILDVQKVLDAVVTMYRADIKCKRINLSVRPDAAQCFVRGDPGRLQQAFWNILKNAVKFTPEDGSIAITTHNDQQGKVQITFNDSGLGMSPEMLGRLFQPFEQETAGRYGGLGLGLAITKTILEAQQGTIEAKSDGLGKGASFIITLPCVERGIEAPPASPEPRKSNSQATDSGYRVLLVEDHVDTARVLARLLAINEHTVTTTHSIADALQALQRDYFDILVSDIGLPDGTGIDLIRAVRKDLRKTLPAIALTGFGMDADVKRTLKAGFNDHLTKPVNFARLEETIQRACKR